MYSAWMANDSINTIENNDNGDDEDRNWIEPWSSRSNSIFNIEDEKQE